MRRTRACKGCVGGVEKHRFVGSLRKHPWLHGRVACLAAEAVQGAAVAIESVDHVQGSDGLAPGVLSVRITFSRNTLSTPRVSS